MEQFLNKKIDQAIKFSVEAHKNQVRKTEPNIPYVYHPISVGFILKNAGFDEDTIVAGILHDTIEDTKATGEEIEEVFGKTIRKLVESVSENKELPYEEMKQKYLEVVLAGNEKTKAISIADSLQNIHNLIVVYKEKGEEVWKPFTRDKELMAEHYTKKVQAILDIWPHPLAEEALKMAYKLKALIN